MVAVELLPACLRNSLAWIVNCGNLIGSFKLPSLCVEQLKQMSPRLGRWCEEAVHMPDVVVD
jgi:hypothetical protein